MIDPDDMSISAVDAIDAIETGGEFASVFEFLGYAEVKVQQFVERCEAKGIGRRQDGPLSSAEHHAENDFLFLRDLASFLGSLDRAMHGKALGYKLEWRRAAGGRPKEPGAMKYSSLFGLQVPAYYDGLCAEGRPKKNAVTDTAAKFGIGRSTVFKYLKARRERGERSSQS